MKLYSNFSYSAIKNHQTDTLHTFSKLNIHILAINMASEEPNITLYTTQTPNGIKISITLEELG
jgi:hypothetical protein